MSTHFFFPFLIELLGESILLGLLMAEAAATAVILSVLMIISTLPCDFENLSDEDIHSLINTISYWLFQQDLIWIWIWIFFFVVQFEKERKINSLFLLSTNFVWNLFLIFTDFVHNHFLFYFSICGSVLEDEILAPTLSDDFLGVGMAKSQNRWRSQPNN